MLAVHLIQQEYEKKLEALKNFGVPKHPSFWASLSQSTFFPRYQMAQFVSLKDFENQYEIQLTHKT